MSEDGNLYSYCQNDPINRSDESGYLSKFWKRIIKIAVGVVATVAAVAITVATGGTALPVVAGVVASTVIGGVVSGAVQAANDWIEGNEINLGRALGSAAFGFVLGGIGGGAQHGLTGARQAALSTKNQIAQKFASGGYRTYNNYLFAKNSNALRIKNVTRTLNKKAIINIIDSYRRDFDAMFYQAILLG